MKSRHPLRRFHFSSCDWWISIAMIPRNIFQIFEAYQFRVVLFNFSDKVLTSASLVSISEGLFYSLFQSQVKMNHNLTIFDQ